MQLHECLLLAVHQNPPSINVVNLNYNFPGDAFGSSIMEEGYLPTFFTNDSSTTIQSPSEQPARPTKYTQGSILSMLQCILLEWGTKSRTNFYIPPENFAGYSYLCDECQQSGWWRWSSSSARNHIQLSYSAHCNARPSSHGHHPTAFVHAEQQLPNLHPHHHDISWYYNLTMRANTTAATHNMLHKSGTIGSLENAVSSLHVGLDNHPSKSVSTTTNAPLSANNQNVYSSAPMTMPYIHPSLELPVPPLHLPLYFGLLCWSFAFAGALMLRLPQKWTVHGGSHRCMRQRHRHGDRHVKFSRHWFPYRAFAWVLILWQSPCSFLADYVHMTNISVWHVIDRFSACIMMLMELVKLVTMRPYTRPAIYILYLISCGIAVFCFLKGQESLKSLSEDGFIFWHSGWHCYPIIASIVHLLEIFLNMRYGEYYKFGCDDQNVDHGPSKREGESTEMTGVLHCHEVNVSSVAENVNTISPSISRRSLRVAGLKPE